MSMDFTQKLLTPVIMVYLHWVEELGVFENKKLWITLPFLLLPVPVLALVDTLKIALVCWYLTGSFVWWVITGDTWRNVHGGLRRKDLTEDRVVRKVQALPNQEVAT